MSQPYVILAEHGPGDLCAFRDAAITYSAARRSKARLEIEGSEAARDLLDWLGIEAMEGGRPDLPWGGAYLDPSRTLPTPVPVRRLPPWSDLPQLSLESFRQQGYVPEAMFAALIRSSYGPNSLDFFPTRSELGFYFEDSLLLPGPARWDEEYLEACQTFFMEELMPAELVAKSIAMVPRERRASLAERAQRWETELHAVTFLVCAELERLAPLAALVSGLLALNSPAPGLKELVQSVELWDGPGWASAWNGQPPQQRQALARELCPGFEELAEAILFTAGPELLLWRASAITEALR